MEILEPWFATSDSRMVDELHRELPPGHVLENVELSAVAYRKDRDEVLYAFNDGSGCLAAVHLTYRKTRETDPKFPKSWLFESPEQWLEYVRAAHAAWVEKDLDGKLWLQEQKLWDAARKF